MKKLLLSFLTLFGCTILPEMPKQSIFTDNYAYQCEKINTDKLTVAEVALSPKCESLVLIERKKWFYRDLLMLHDRNELTNESLVATLKCRHKFYDYQPTNSPTINEMHISELLKEQKNRLIRRNNKLVMDCGPLFGDNAAQDYLMLAGYSGLLAVFFATPELTKESYAMAAVAIGSWAKVYSMYRTVRNNEAEMNKIDAMISAIEKLEQTEVQ
jgi:hypothetical protein